MRLAIGLIMIMMLTASIIHCAEIVEIPLNGLHGIYSHFDTECRLDTFYLSRLPDTVYNVWIRLTGNGRNGTSSCDWCWGICISDGMLFTVTIDETVTELEWNPSYGDSPSSIKNYDLDFFFPINSSNAWMCLKLGACVLQLGGIPRPLPSRNHFWWCEYPSAEFTSAFIIIEADFSVDTNKTTWSRMKGFYLK